MSDLFEIKRNPNIIEIPNNATNGDVIKALFPEKDWWNAPYKKGENNETDN